MTGKSPTTQKIFLVYGPTGSGKTRMALEIAERLDGEIISADSRQIYRGLDIGTGKIMPGEMRGIPHYGLDLIDPDQTYNAAMFRDYAREKIQGIRSRGKTAVVCGGTGLYIDALIFDLDVPAFESDPEYQSNLEKFRREHGNERLWQRLEALDPEYAKEIHPNSYPYVMRGLEIIERTGVSKREYRSERRLGYDVMAVTPYSDEFRARLYENINSRVDGMFRNGLVEETTELLRQGFSPDSPGLRTIGYAETCRFLAGELTLERAMELVQQGNRNYAKRQVTWCKKYASLPHVSPGDM
jgi:tRNA dimethylallyltransferase